MNECHVQHIELSRSAYHHNLTTFRKMVLSHCRLMAVVKANAYGHGLLPMARLAQDAGIDILGVDCLEEGVFLRQSGIHIPIIILGYINLKNLSATLDHDLEPVLYNLASLHQLEHEATVRNKTAPFHLKLETGLHRQGILEEELPDFLDFTTRAHRLSLVGLSMHFANIEDTTDHSYARYQLANFTRMAEMVRERTGLNPALHTACTAAVILFDETHFDMVRVGIGSYGLWSSKETYLSTILGHHEPPVLKPVMCWKSRIAQLKEIPARTFVGYGCSYRTTQRMRMAVIPVGYYDGYDRRLSNQCHVLIRGKRAPILGRVCMNMIMVDVTHIPDVQLEDETVLLGPQGNETISAEELAELCHTINYEVVTRIVKHYGRIVVD